MKRVLGAGCWVLGIAMASSVAVAQAPPSPNTQHPTPSTRDVILATTTSLYETGLIDTLVTLFAQQTGYHLRAIAVGSGQALKMGERGDADVIFAHSPAAERAFMAAGNGTRRRVVATNYFTILGPPDDPAHVREAPNANEAFRRIAASGRTFVSRGDSSGTHARELLLWGPDRPHWPGYIETGQGMSATLLVAYERQGYTLCDRSTYGSLRHRVDLVPLREREPALLNVYHVIEVNPAGRPRLNAAGGTAFADFIVSPAIQDLLAHFGEARYGAPLYTPARGVEP